jgi:tripartite-type tricarboxylate transporter receptor subunit TctC
MRVARITFAVVLGVFCVTTALAQPWPSRPIRFIVPFPPGGPTDVIGRTAAQILQAALGQPVVVDNRPGGAGTVGLGVLAKAPPDGYTLGLPAITLAIAPHLGPVPFDPLKDFTLISNIGATTPMVAANPSFPANNLAELIAYARANPGKVLYGTPGVGTTPHLAAELLQNATGITLVHVPYKGTAQLTQDLLAGAITLSFEAGLTSAYPNIKAGKLKPLVMLTERRSRLLPELPTAVEQGYASVSAAPWWGLGGPAGLGRDMVMRMNEALVQGLKSREVLERFATLGIEAIPTTPEEFEAYVKAEHARWGGVIRRAGIKAE